MTKYIIKIDGEMDFYTEEEMKAKAKELWETEIWNEENYIEEEELEGTERLKELKELSISDIYDIEDNQEFLFDRNIIDEIVEYDYFLTELLSDANLDYDKSTMSKSTYVEIGDEVIRLSDHKSPMFSADYGHKIVTTDLIYRDGIVDNEDLKKYLDIDVEGIVIL